MKKCLALLLTLLRWFWCRELPLTRPDTGWGMAAATMTVFWRRSQITRPLHFALIFSCFPGWKPKSMIFL